jgi:outer membrane lipoprotein carrier protein
MKSILWSVIVLSSLVPGLESKPGAPEPRPELGEVLFNSSRRLHGAPSVTGRFVQTYASMALGRTVEERGHLLLSRSGSIRWTYTEPEKKLFVSSGELAWFYIPDDEVAYRLRLDQERARLLPTRFISGDEGLAEEFHISEVDAPPGRRRLRLQPREPAAEFDLLLLELILPEEEISALIVIDSLGNETTFRFSELERGEEVPDTLFEFTPPEGIEIVTDGG